MGGSTFEGGERMSRRTILASASVPRRLSAAEKRQKRILLKREEISEYEGIIGRAQKTTKDGLYGMIVIVALVVAAALFIVSAVFSYTDGSGSVNAVIIMVGAFVAIAISVAAQFTVLQAENQVRRYTQRLRTAQRELQELEKPSS